MNYLGGHYAAFSLHEGADVDTIRGAVDTGVVTLDVLAAMSRQIAAHPDRPQLDGDASGWLGESILGQAL